jgi:hypothetical protein
MKRRILKWIAVVLFSCCASAVILRVVWVQRLNSGVAAFKYEDYVKAKRELELLAKFGDSTAQDRMIYILGLGLGQEPDFFGAARYMANSTLQYSSADQAYDLGKTAALGAFGENKKTIGALWLAIARQSGSKLEVSESIEREIKREIAEKALDKFYDEAKREK